MLHYLKIKNFGPIDELVEINFEAVDSTGDAYEVVMPDGKVLLKLAYIYGANASGKTTVLRAFDLLRKLLLKPLFDKSQQIDYDPFLFKEQEFNNHTILELSFYCENVRYIYEVIFDRVRITFERLVYFQTAKPTRLFARETNSDNSVSYIQFGNIIKAHAKEKDLLQSNTLHNNTVFGAFAKTNVDIPELEKLHRWFGTFFMTMLNTNVDLREQTSQLIEENPEASKWITTLLNKADSQVMGVELGEHEAVMDEFSKGYLARALLKPNTPDTAGTSFASPNRNFPSGFSVEKRIELVHKIEGKFYKLPLRKESSGTQRYFGLAGPFYRLIHQSHFLCVDELETSLHPDLMKFFLQAFLLNSESSQLLMTTHNQSLLNNSDFIRRDALWFSEKNRKGSVDLYSAADFDTDTLRKDASISKAYQSGRLGAKPNLGSPYMTD